MIMNVGPKRANERRGSLTTNGIPLDGEWQFSLDPGDRGRREQWFKQRSFFSRIKVPGCWQAQGFGGVFKHPIAQIGHPALQVERTGYQGTAWYRKTFRVPESWHKRRAWLTFGGVHPRAEFWCNARYLGQDPGGLLEFKFDVTRQIRRGTDNVITVRVFENARDWATACKGGGI